MTDTPFQMSIFSCLAVWRPLGLLVLGLTALLGFVDLAAFGELMAPREPLARMLVLVTAIEAVWHLGRTVYDAWPGAEEVATAVFGTALEMGVMYGGYASLVTITTVMARATEGMSIGPYIKLVNLAAFCTIAVMEAALMVVHWKGRKGAKTLFSRMQKIADSKGKNLDAAIPKNDG